MFTFLLSASSICRSVACRAFGERSTSSKLVLRPPMDWTWLVWCVYHRDIKRVSTALPI